jgi:LacI family transcriptional regulator
LAKRITMADVAREAGVSLQTVSRAINDKSEISVDTKQRVLEVVKQLGFRPSGIARSLATRRTTSVGLVVPDITNPFFSEIARGVEDVAHAHAYNVFLCNTDEDIQREKAVLDSLLEKQVDGLVLFSSRLDQKDLLERLGYFSFVVLVNREINKELDGVRIISIDDKTGAYQAVDYLHTIGRTKIGFVAGPERSESNRKRFEGYLAAHKKNKQQVDPQLTYRCDKPDTFSGEQAAKKLLEARPDINAFFAFNDLIAVGVLHACQKLGYRVPKDVAIIGCDDIPLASMVTPALSTLHIDKREVGTAAMQILMALIQEDHPIPVKTIFQSRLVLRQSTP